MTVDRIVLDAAGIDEISRSPDLRALLRRAVERGGQIWCAAVTLTEVARGPARTANVHQVLNRRHGGAHVRIQETDVRLALLVGALLNDSGHGSQALADAHVVATCAPAGVALVVTSDPDDITAIATYLPGTRVTCVRPDLAR